MFTLPSGSPFNLITQYEEVINEVINNPMTGEMCRLHYPPKKVPCDCVSVNGGIGSAGYNGAPNLFGNSCAICGGQNYKEVSSTEDLMFNVYRERSSWSKIVGIQIPEAEIMIRGNILVLHKVLKAVTIQTHIDDPNDSWNYKLKGKVIPHGFGNKFFFAFLVT